MHNNVIISHDQIPQRVFFLNVFDIEIATIEQIAVKTNTPRLPLRQNHQDTHKRIIEPTNTSQRLRC
jgi:hypothetical protein